MVRRILGIYILICVSCFTISAKSHDNKIDPTKIFLVFYDCDKDIAKDEATIKCSIQNTNCIEDAYHQIKKDKNEITIYIHGYHGNRNSTPATDIISAYCSRNFSVLALLDWSQLAIGKRLLLIANQASKIGKIVASTFDSLNDKGYEIAKWHLIGHSMGAHLAGCIGKHTDFSFLHITGLDPPGVIFYSDMYKGCRLNSKAAHFTDIFYTDRGGYGVVKNIGSLNIYIDMGTAPQSGCYSLSTDIHMCSHVKAGKLYADTVINEAKYLATKCVDCFLFLLDDNYCKENDKIYIGPHVDMKATGTYCLPIDLKNYSFPTK